jgi:hypothetical protein
MKLHPLPRQRKEAKDQDFGLTQKQKTKIPIEFMAKYIEIAR